MAAEEADSAADDLPVTVPIQLKHRRKNNPLPMQTIEAPPADLTLSLRAAHEAGLDVQTPSIRVAVRNAATRTPANRGSPPQKVLVSPPQRVSNPRANVIANAAEPRLRVLRGQRINADYPIYTGANFLGRRDDEPIDIDLEDQEPAERIWISRRHAVIYFQGGGMEIEDLNSMNGTFVNRIRIAPNQRRELKAGDILQIGTVQMRVTT